MIWALHGNLGSPRDWASAGTGQLEAVDVYATGGDLAGFGRELNRQVREAGDASAVVLGYSMGGRLALHCLLERDHPWTAAVIVSAHTGLATDGERRERLERDRVWARRLRQESPGEFWAAWNAQEVFGASEGAPSYVADPRGFEEWSLGEQEDLLGRLPEIRVPVLWVTGGGDPRYTAIGTHACAALPNGRHAVVPGATHRVPWEAPDAFREAIGSFAAAVRGLRE